MFSHNRHSIVRLVSIATAALVVSSCGSSSQSLSSKASAQEGSSTGVQSMASSIPTISVVQGATSVSIPSISYSFSQSLSKATVQFYLNVSGATAVTEPGTTNFTAGVAVTFSNIVFSIPANTPVGDYYVTSEAYAAAGSVPTGRLVEVVVNAAAPSPTPTPTATGSGDSVSPNPAAAGQTITISGNYTVSTTYSGAYLDLWMADAAGDSGLPSATVKMNFTANVAAPFSATMNIPASLAPGSYEINAQVYGGSSTISKYGTIATFTVGGATPSPSPSPSPSATGDSVSPNPAAAGQTITISGNYTVSTTYSGAYLDLWMADAAGDSGLPSATVKMNFTANVAAPFSATMNIPASLAPGSYEINAQVYGGSSTISKYGTIATFTVGGAAPSPSPTPTTTSSGSSVTSPVVADQSGLCLDITGASGSAGVLLEQWTCNGGSNQNFEFTPNSNGTYQIQAMNSGLCLDAGAATSLTDVTQETCLGSSSQQWLVQADSSYGSSYYMIETNSTQLCLNVDGGSTSAGASMIVYNCSGNPPNEAFEIEGLSSSSTPTPTPTSTPTSTPTQNPSPVPSSGAGVKWHPGNYVLSDQIVPRSPVSADESEIDEAFSNANVSGYMAIFYWNDFENQTEGSYNFSDIDALRSYIATKYPGKRFAAMIWWNDGHASQVVPSYIQNNSAYGASSTSGQYGYWDSSVSGWVSAAIWRPAVYNRVIALFQALGAHTSPYGGGAYTYDTDPYFEAVTGAESSTALSSTPKDYSIGAFATGYESIVAGMVSAFPHTNILDQNNFLGYTGSSTTTTGNAMIVDGNAGAAISGPDVMYSNLTWEQLAYIGSANGGTSGFSNSFGTYPYIALIETPDYPYGTQAQSTATVLNLPTMSAVGLGAPEAYWEIESTGSGQPGDWSTVVSPSINSNPIPAANKVCPKNYIARGGCNSN